MINEVFGLSKATHVVFLIMNQSALKMPTRQQRLSRCKKHILKADVHLGVCGCLSVAPLLQISMSVQTALLSVIVNPLVSTCPAGTTASVVTATMTTACFPPMGTHVWVS